LVAGYFIHRGSSKGIWSGDIVIVVNPTGPHWRSGSMLVCDQHHDRGGLYQHVDHRRSSSRNITIANNPRHLLDGATPHQPWSAGTTIPPSLPTNTRRSVFM